MAGALPPVSREDCGGRAGGPGPAGGPGSQSRGRAVAAAFALSRLLVLLLGVQNRRRELGPLPAPGRVEGGVDVAVP